MKNNRIRTFDRAQKYLNSLPNINAGGCGISALAMHRWMVKNKVAPFHFDFICVYRKKYSDRYITNKSYVDNGLGNLIAPNHVLYNFNGVLYDSNGKRSLKGYAYSIRLKSEENLIKMIGNVSEWNSRFSQKKYIACIEQELDISLKDIYESVPDSHYLNIFVQHVKKMLENIKSFYLISINNTWMKTIQSTKMSC